MENRKKKQKPFSGFDGSLSEINLHPLESKRVEILQINMGKLCNQVCKHCHVDAGPTRPEIMTKEILSYCLTSRENLKFSTVDITGGAPEMNPHFQWFVKECRQAELTVIVRSNLTIMLEPGYEAMPEFLKENNVELIASLPCYTKENVDLQRGCGVFEKSINVLKTLNNIGYGNGIPDLRLNLVYNPGGASLPGDQKELEIDYKNRLNGDYGITFNNLYTITNMPIGRFRKQLKEEGQFEKYMKLLEDSFNPAAAENVMCRDILSVGWDGMVYDCDFNQMLNLPCGFGAPKHINDYNFFKSNNRRIVTGDHCYGCTAGAGSSCQGVLDKK